MFAARVVWRTLSVAAARARQRRQRGRHTSAIAAAAEASVQILFLNACRVAAAAIDRDRVEAALRSGHDAALDTALASGIAALDDAMRQPLATLLAAVYSQTRQWAAGQLGQIEMRPAPSTWVRAAAADPYVDAVQWALTRAATLISYITDDMQAAIQQLVAAAFREGIPPPELARLIIEQAGIGLTTAQVASVLGVFTRLRAALPGTLVSIGARRVRVPEAGWAAGDVARHVDRYAARQRTARALLIARTETITAANAGQQALWMRAIRERWLLPGTKRRWSAAPTACLRCKTLNGQTVGMTEPFRGPDGPVLHPPAHPACRCAVVLDL